MFPNSKTPYLSLLACWLSIMSLSAQFVNQGQTVFVSSNTQLTVLADMVNNGALTNNGTVRITGNAVNSAALANNQMILLNGDWTNRGRYEAGGSERFVLYGGQQRIRHNGQHFNRLVVRGGEKFFEQSATVNRQLVLRQGLVTPSPSTMFLLLGGIVIDSASADSYVNGELYRAGRAGRFYPVGNTDGYAPAWLEADESGLKDSLVVAMKVLRTSETLKILPDTSLDRISAVRYWSHNVAVGSSTARAELSILPDENLASLDSVVVAALPEDQKTTFRSIGQRNIGQVNGMATVKSNNYANAKLLAIGVMSSPDKSGLIYVPNVFAPASGNDNEKVFKIYGTNLAPGSLQLVVYNRWGNVVFSSQSTEQITGQGWDGHNQATRDEVVAGVYTYTLKGAFNTGKTFQKTGTVTLLR